MYGWEEGITILNRLKPVTSGFEVIKNHVVHVPCKQRENLFLTKLLLFRTQKYLGLSSEPYHNDD